jgi:fructosamine-3-kinase
MVGDARIDEILKKAGCAGCPVRAIGAGHYNDSYYIDTEQGRFVLRIAPPDSVPKLFYEIDMMKSEVGIHELVRDQTNLPVAQIVYHDFSREVVYRDYLIMDYLEGSPAYLDEKELGGYVRELHAIKSDRCGYPERTAPTGESWHDIFETYVELIFKDCLSCGIIDRHEYDYFLSIYKKHSAVIAEVPASLLHLDLWSQNILTVDGRITGILDFDRGLYGDPELEFAVLDTYGYSGPEFFAGYGQPRPNDSKAQIRQRLYIVYELIKYAFIRSARNKKRSVGRSHVEQCKGILQGLA